METSTQPQGNQPEQGQRSELRDFAEAVFATYFPLVKMNLEINPHPRPIDRLASMGAAFGDIFLDAASVVGVVATASGHPEGLIPAAIKLAVTTAAWPRDPEGHII